MSRLLYEKSVSYQGHLIIPFVFGSADNQPIYSYKLLSELSHKSKYHKAENPASIYSCSVEQIINVAKEHLDTHCTHANTVDNFKRRYTYRNNLIIISQVAGKYFYDHYPPNNLNNIAAPKIFISEQECINWIKQGLDHSSLNREIKLL